MNFNGVELLKMQFSRAVNQTFESFLDALKTCAFFGSLEESG
ncbi:MAG TPA: hypothetical protein VFE56_13485 [Candidatus Binataceae bacterium]|jgi:hypothetical protein|nr:hypothetical protein [Candidatus Binataceae bacterium]